MSNLDEIILTYNKAKVDLAKHFDIVYPIFTIEDYRGVFWNYDFGCISWSEDDLDVYNPEYSEEAVFISAVDEYSLYLIHLCMGESYYAIFDDSKEIK